MTGTTFKLSFDGTSVTKGLQNLNKKLAGFSKEVARGMALTVGNVVTNTIGKLVGAAPQAIMDTVNAVGELQDLAMATGESIENLTMLKEAFRLAGAEGVDSARMISTMRKSIMEATREAGPARDALQALELDPFKMSQLKPIDMFKKIGEAVSKLPNDSGALRNLDQITTNIFGGKMGYKFLGAFKDIDATMASAAENTATFRENVKGLGPSLDALGEAMTRLPMAQQVEALKAIRALGPTAVAGLTQDTNRFMSDPSGTTNKILELIHQDTKESANLLKGIKKFTPATFQ